MGPELVFGRAGAPEEACQGAGVVDRSSGMDVHIWKKFPDLLLPLGFVDMKVETFNLGYGATSTRPEDRIWTAELLPQSFRHLARKIPGMYHA